MNGEEQPVQIRMYKDDSGNVFVSAEDLINWIKEGLDTPKIHPMARTVCLHFKYTIQCLVDQVNPVQTEKEEGWDG